MSIKFPCIFRDSQPCTHATDKGLALVLGCHNPDIEYNKCSLGTEYPGVAFCDTCTKSAKYPEDKKLAFDSDNWHYIKTADMVADATRLCRYVPHNCAGIVGIPRSGMVAASAIAALTSKPLYELDIPKGIKKIGSGGRMWFEDLDTTGPYFVVDDSVYQGNAMSLAQDIMCGSGHSSAIFAVIYARPDKSHLISHCVRELESPHLFEWNLYNNGMVSGECDDTRFKGGIAFDFDGIFSPDPPMPDADDGPLLDEYLEYIRTAPSTHIQPVLRKIPLIITLRLEKWRSVCDMWLRKNGISYDEMIMCPFENVSQRIGVDGGTPKEIILRYKAEPFANSKCSMMIESDPWQAVVIHDATGKPVLCPQTGEVFHSIKSKS